MVVPPSAVPPPGTKRMASLVASTSLILLAGTNPHRQARSHLLPREHTMMHPVCDMLRCDAECCAILHEPHVVEVGHLRTGSGSGLLHLQSTVLARDVLDVDKSRCRVAVSTYGQYRSLSLTQAQSQIEECVVVLTNTQ